MGLTYRCLTLLEKDLWIHLHVDINIKRIFVQVDEAHLLAQQEREQRLQLKREYDALKNQVRRL